MKNIENTLFKIGDNVEVLANNGDMFYDFVGTVIGFQENGIVKVRDQDDDVWNCNENQCYKL